MSVKHFADAIPRLIDISSAANYIIVSNYLGLLVVVPGIQTFPYPEPKELLKKPVLWGGSSLNATLQYNLPFTLQFALPRIHVLGRVHHQDMWVVVIKSGP